MWLIFLRVNIQENRIIAKGEEKAMCQRSIFIFDLNKILIKFGIQGSFLNLTK